LADVTDASYGSFATLKYQNPTTASLTAQYMLRTIIVDNIYIQCHCPGMKTEAKRLRQTALDDGSTPQSDAVVLSVRLGALLATELDEFFHEWRITHRLFNVLRILYVRDPERKGLSRGFIEQRLIHRMPDVTRLIDRLEAAGLVARHRPKDDQRTVLTTLTDKGWDLVEQSHAPLLKLNRSQLPHFSKAELTQFIALVQKALHRPAQ
jgi:DNA-binding MarR family transcriptional regulator